MTALEGRVGLRVEGLSQKRKKKELKDRTTVWWLTGRGWMGAEEGAGRINGDAK